uniref:RNA polymerase alpha subunit n=1 Tax=Chlamydomonas chlamydogama TaxID=225041 RepID=UPI00226CCB25|nr:RNA polymerase alpha subunit [Chlamydomonas chlamydogama]UZA61962.1 RNA polymerase alpha subunit [Chlamydomonas chlamydogama]
MNQFFISCKDTKVEQKRSFYGCFYLGPFDPNQSITIANALRRTLLSELHGLAIICVEIEGVTHEYSNIPGLKDSVLDILLNLKEIVLKKTCKNFKPQIGYLRVKGPGIVRANDLRLPPFIQCVDPNQYIATLATDGMLNMKFIIHFGKNYIASQNKNNENFFKKDKNVKMQSSLVLKKLKQFSNDLILNQTQFGLFNSTILNNNKFLNKYKKTSSFSNDNINNDLKHSSNNSGVSLLEKSLQNKKQNLNSNPLNIDAIFNPITKVNYTIEVNDYKTVQKAFEIANETDNLYTMLKSTENNESISIKKNQAVQALAVTNTEVLVKNSLNNFLKIMSKDLDNLLQLKEDINFIEKENVSHNIILEIWTNGSVHPRDALYLAFKKLTTTLIKLQKTCTFSAIYKTEKSYNNLLKNLKNEQIDTKPLTETTFLSNYTNPKLKQYNFLNLKSSIKKQLKLKYIKLNVNKVKLKESQQINKQLTILKKIDLPKQDIGILNLSLRTYACLKRLQINTITDLLEISKSSLLSKKVEKKHIEEIEKCLSQIGYQLKNY